MTATVFHTIIWTEAENDIVMTLGLEGTIATREAAERVADAYREWLRIGYEIDGTPENVFRSRVGILEMPMPDPRLKHPAPCEDVDQIIAEIQSRVNKKRNPS